MFIYVKIVKDFKTNRISVKQSILEFKSNNLNNNYKRYHNNFVYQITIS